MKITGGTAARASEINTETVYALHLFNTPKPEPIEELLVSMPHAGVCLVDHQQVSQLNKSIDVSPTSSLYTYVEGNSQLNISLTTHSQVDRIVGVIDHHALQNATIVTDKPIYIDIRPWGSMSTSKTPFSKHMKSLSYLILSYLISSLNLQNSNEVHLLPCITISYHAHFHDIQAETYEEHRRPAALRYPQ